MLIAMAGLPGSGKSTVAGELGRLLGMPVVSVDPLESAILRAGISPEQPTGLAAYLVAETIAEAVLSARQGVIVDAVNAVSPARDQWVMLGDRLGIDVRFIETACSDPGVHRLRLDERRLDERRFNERRLEDRRQEGRQRDNAQQQQQPQPQPPPQSARPSGHAVEHSLDEYAAWSGLAGSRPRLTLDTVAALAQNVERAAAFLRD